MAQFGFDASNRLKIEKRCNQLFGEGILIKLINIKTTHDITAMILDSNESNMWIVSSNLASKLLVQNITEKKRLEILKSIRKEFMEKQIKRMFYEIDNEIFEIHSFQEFSTKNKDTSKSSTLDLESSSNTSSRKILTPVISGNTKSCVKIFKTNTSSPVPQVVKRTTARMHMKPTGQPKLGKKRKNSQDNLQLIQQQTNPEDITVISDDEHCSNCDTIIEKLILDKNQKQQKKHSICNTCQRLTILIDEPLRNESQIPNKRTKPEEPEEPEIDEEDNTEDEEDDPKNKDKKDEIEHEVNKTEDEEDDTDRKSTRLNSSHANISYAVFCLKKKKKKTTKPLFSVIYCNFSPLHAFLTTLSF